MNLVNPYRFAAAGGGIATPTHWWDLDNVTATDGINDKGTGDWGDLGVSGPTQSAAAGPNGQNVLAFVNDGGGGDADYLSGGNQVWDGGSNTTISWQYWFTADVIASTGNFLVSWRSSTTTRLMNGLLLNDTPDYIFNRIFDDNDSGFTVGNTTDTTFTADDSTWYHVVTTVNLAGDIKVYVNGTLKATVDASSLTTFDNVTAMPFAIGTAGWSLGASNSSHDGKIFSVGIWDVELTSADASNLYAGGSSGDGFYGDYTFV